MGEDQVRVWSRWNDRVYDLPEGDHEIGQHRTEVLGRANDFVCVVRGFNSRCIEPGHTERVPDARDESDESDAPEAIPVPAEAAPPAQRADRREQE